MLASAIKAANSHRRSVLNPSQPQPVTVCHWTTIMTAFQTCFLTIPKLLETEFRLFFVNCLRPSSTRPLHQTFAGRHGKHHFQPCKCALLDHSRKHSHWTEDLRGHVGPGVVRIATATS